MKYSSQVARFVANERLAPLSRIPRNAAPAELIRKAHERLTATFGRGFLRGVRLPPSAARAAFGLSFAITLAASRGFAAPSDDEGTLDELARDTAHATLVAGPRRLGQDALRRAKAMEQAGDTAHARLARALAHEWTRVATDLIRAVAFEEKAKAVEKALSETETRTVRGRSLLEETAARRGRAQAALEQLEHAPPPPPTAPAAKGHAEKPSTPVKPRVGEPE